MMQPERISDVRRDYSPADVERRAGSFRIRHTLAEMGAARLRHLLRTESFLPTLGALTDNQAVQQLKAGLKAIYLSGWQVAADANTAGQMYPDQRSTRSIPCPMWSGASTMRFAVPTRSPIWKATATTLIGWRRSLAMPRRGL